MEKTKKYLLKVELIAVIIIMALGVLLHYTYQLSGNNWFVANFSAVNESTWEHLKLSFFPILVIGIIEYFFVKGKAKNYIEAKTISAVISIIFIIVFFYTYTGIIGTHFAIMDFLTFIFAVLLGEFSAYKIMTAKKFSTKTTKIISIAITTILLICFIAFTYNPPHINLFKDPTNEDMGTAPESSCFQPKSEEKGTGYSMF